MNLNQYRKLIRQQKNKVRNKLAKDTAKLNALIANKENTIIKYPEYKEAFEYVDNKFPGLNVLNVTVYKVSRKALAEAGYEGVGGLYIFGKRAVIATDEPTGGSPKEADQIEIKANVLIDEVIVHELCHYVSHRFYRTNDVLMEEEFAYGHSVPYLKGKGYTDEEIIKHTMLPFLYSSVDRDSLLVKVAKEKGIKPMNLNGFIREAKSDSADPRIKSVVLSIFDEVHERTLATANKKGQFLIDSYQDVSNDGENDGTRYTDLEI